MKFPIHSIGIHASVYRISIHASLLFLLAVNAVSYGAYSDQGQESTETGNTQGTVYLMTPSTSKNFTYLHIINSSGTAQKFTGTLYNQGGAQLGNTLTPLHTGSIPPQGRLILTSAELEAIFSTTPWKGPAILEVRGISNFDLMTKLTSPSGLTSNTNCVRVDRVDNVEGFDSDSMTYIRFINTGNTTINAITGTLYDSSGSVIGQADIVFVNRLNPKQAVWLNRNDLGKKLGKEWRGAATLVTTDSVPGLKLLNLNFMNSETFFNFSCYESSS